MTYERQTHKQLGFLEELDEWVDSFPIEAVQRELNRLQEQKGTLEAAINALSRKLTIWNTLRSAHHSNGDPPKYPTKRDALLAFFDEHPERELRLAEIRDGLIARGWAGDDAKSSHALQMALLTAHKRGEVDRVEKGVYKLAATRSRAGAEAEGVAA